MFIIYDMILNIYVIIFFLFFIVILFVTNKYGTVQELRSTFSHTKSINIDFARHKHN